MASSWSIRRVTLDDFSLAASLISDGLRPCSEPSSIISTLYSGWEMPYSRISWLPWSQNSLCTSLISRASMA
ncbi:hypothetical protein D3C71_2107090 [compost metagenome]